VHLSSGREVADAMIAGSSVQVGYELPGRGQHDRVESGSLVRNPSSESILGGFGEVSDMDLALSEVEVECSRLAVAEGEDAPPFAFGECGTFRTRVATSPQVAMVGSQAERRMAE
jgi:hypothetical protein